MKKTIFTLINMNVGGTEKSFINLVNQLPQEQYDISLLLLENKGELLKQLPPHIKILELQEYADLKFKLSDSPRIQLKKLLLKRSLKEAFFLVYTYLYKKVMNDSRPYYKYLVRDIPALTEEFDLAIAYAGPMDFITYFTNYRIKAKEKIQWIHFDITKIGFDPVFAKNMYKNFSKIYVVSKEAGIKLTDLIPEIRSKVEIYENIISKVKIKEMASHKEVLKYSGIKIVTVARLTKEKAPERALNVCKQLIENGFDITWHWIGDGPMKDYISYLIDQNNLKKSFILEGSKANPYPYINAADIYVQPSDHEGYCLTIAEAKALNKPIVTTATAGAVDQIINNETGLITEIDDVSLLDGITKLLNSYLLRSAFSQALNNEKDKIRSDFI